MLSRRAMMNDEIVSEQGKNLVLQKCKGSYLHGMKVYGHTTQQTTTGAQLLDDSTLTQGMINIATGELSMDNSFVLSDFIPVESSAFYHLNAGQYANYVLFYDAEKTYLGQETAIVTSNYPTFKTPESAYFARLRFYNADGLTPEQLRTQRPMFNAGSTALPWEPYTGGIPSPNPDYPQELVSAGDKGNIELKVIGKNLFYKTGYRPLCDIFLKSGITISISAESTWDDYVIELHNADGTITAVPTVLNNDRKTVTLTTQKDVKAIMFRGNVSEPQVEISPVVTSYEPCKAQTLTMLTPNGLPGIPVSSGGNYTDENGQQWIADYRDWERGVDVKRVWKGVIDGSGIWQLYTSMKGFYFSAFPEVMGVRNGISNQLRIVSSSAYADSDNAILGANNSVLYVLYSSFYDDSLEDKGLANWKAHLAEHPLEIMTYLDDPIETPIPAEELAAYKALHTNTPTTTIVNDEDCWMKVTHRRLRG